MLKSEREAWADIHVEQDEQLYDQKLLSDNASECWSSSNSQHSQSNVKKKKLINRKLDKAQIHSSQGEDTHSDSGGSSPSRAQGEQAHSETTGTAFSTVDSEDFSDIAALYASNAQDKEGGWSKGAVLHESGTCKPCLFVHNPVGCQNGVECEFCHLRHSRSSRPRPSKGKRDRIKRLTAVGDKEVGESNNQATCKQDLGKQPPGKFSL